LRRDWINGDEKEAKEEERNGFAGHGYTGGERKREREVTRRG
jgi:hypothetical protein